METAFVDRAWCATVREFRHESGKNGLERRVPPPGSQRNGRFQAFFNGSDRYPGIVNGAFFWDNWIATDAMWAETWLGRRSFAIRGKLAEAIVRDAYTRLEP